MISILCFYLYLLCIILLLFHCYILKAIQFKNWPEILTIISFKIWREILHWCQDVMSVLNWIAFITMFVILAGIWNNEYRWVQKTLPGFSATYICIYAHFPLSSVDGHFVGLCVFFSTYIPTTTIRSVATKKSLLLPPPR